MCRDKFYDDCGWEHTTCQEAEEMEGKIACIRERARDLVDTLFDEEIEEQMFIEVLEDFCKHAEIYPPTEMRMHERAREFIHGIKCTRVINEMGLRAII